MLHLILAVPQVIARFGHYIIILYQIFHIVDPNEVIPLGEQLNDQSFNDSFSCIFKLKFVFSVEKKSLNSCSIFLVYLLYEVMFQNTSIF